MLSRAERLADPAFFSERHTCRELVFARLPATADVSHGLVWDKEHNKVFCSCPWQPKPCVHALAFERLTAEAPDAFAPTDQVPDWVVILQSSQKGGAHEPFIVEHTHQKAEQQQQRHFARLERAEKGFQDLELWLLDTLRRGLATTVSEDPDFFNSIAGRLADASMRGLSRSIRLLGTLSPDQPDWADRVLAVLADAALALQAFQNRERLPENLEHDLENFIGIAVRKDAVLAEGERLTDRWAVVGALEEQVEEALRQRRTWLLGARSNRFALLLEYAHGAATGFLPGFTPGTVLEGTLVFYPSAWPLRALPPEPLTKLGSALKQLPGFIELNALAHAYATALGKQPWLTQFPAVLNAATVFRQNTQFHIADEAGKSIPLQADELLGWSLLALGEGRPITLFGEWDGQTFRVLSAVARNRFVTF